MVLNMIVIGDSWVNDIAYFYLVNDCVVLVLTGIFTSVFCAVFEASYPRPFFLLTANDNPTRAQSQGDTAG